MMQRILLFLIAIPILIFSFFTTIDPQEDDKKIEELISKMTLEEKVGQMTNLTLATIADEKDGKIVLDDYRLIDAVQNHHIGSFQNVINHAYTLEEWHNLTNTIQKITLDKSRLKIPSLYCIDAVHGADYTVGSTIFPHNLALGATRNPELVKKCAEVTALEVRASGIRYNFSPVLDAGRHQNWPRLPETFGEDIVLVKTLGGAAIQGYQGNNLLSPNSVAACMKHYVGYSNPNNGKDRAPAYIPEIVLREYYLPSFKHAIEIGAKTLMVNSADVNGIPVHANKYLLTDVLRTELGFKGMVISDWEDIKKMVGRHRVAENNKEATYLAVSAGIDMCIVPFDFSFYNDVIALVKEGRIKEERINESVRRILKLKMDLGLFKNPYLEKEAVPNFGKKEYKEVALQASRESVILLKNHDNILPLKKTANVLLTGPAADSRTSLNGAWTYSWQGKDEKYFSKNQNTIRSAFNIKLGDKLKYSKGTEFDKELNIADVSELSKNAEVIVVCLGEEGYAETPGNTPDLELAIAQKNLIYELHKTGKPIVLILSEGRPRIIREIEPIVSAIVLSTWGGEMAADGIADVIFGDYNPDGKLPFTYPRYSGELLTYDHKQLDEAVEVAQPYSYNFIFNPQFEFGHGLSYTTFSITDLKVSKDTFSLKEPLTVSVNVKNTGTTGGKIAVELYIRDEVASVVPPVKRLKSFKKISLAPGASQEIKFELTEKDFAFIGQDLKWRTESGEFMIMIGNEKKKVYLKK